MLLTQIFFPQVVAWHLNLRDVVRLHALLGRRLADEDL